MALSAKVALRAAEESCELKVSKTEARTPFSSSCPVWCKIRKDSWAGLHIPSIPCQLMAGDVLLGGTPSISPPRIQRAAPCYAKSLLVNTLLPLNGWECFSLESSCAGFPSGIHRRGHLVAAAHWICTTPAGDDPGGISSRMQRDLSLPFS